MSLMDKFGVIFISDKQKQEAKEFPSFNFVTNFALEDPDAHSCRAEADEWGHCRFCGATVYGSAAYYEECGADPPGTY
ncbi:MAG: hypothetical protein J6J66_02155 [Clostridia bacterium]|nr:hypothetical protein [Clostridia bacterium]